MIEGVRFRVLGTVGLTIDGAEMPLTASRQRALLALLMLDANVPQSSEALIEGIWGERTPQHPEAALQIAVSRLRATMGPAGSRIVSRRVVTRSSSTKTSSISSRQNGCMASGKTRSNMPTRHAATAALDDALRCWRGEALVDVGDPQFCDDAKRDLHELRLAIYEARNDAYLLAGRHVEVLADIEISGAGGAVAGATTRATDDCVVSRRPPGRRAGDL